MQFSKTGSIAIDENWTYSKLIGYPTIDFYIEILRFNATDLYFRYKEKQSKTWKMANSELLQKIFASNIILLHPAFMYIETEPFGAVLKIKLLYCVVPWDWGSDNASA